LQQFTQRVTVHCHLDALNRKEIDTYIKFRLRVAGAKRPDLFDEAAIGAIAEYSRGIPRLINILSDTALVYGFADSKEKIDQQVIEEVVKERESSGIFVGDNLETADDPALPGDVHLRDIPTAISGNGNGLVKERINLLEHKISRLEEVCDNLNQLLGDFSQKRDEKDAMIVELLKLLKNSMDSRFQLINHVSDMSKKVNAKT
jgi:general secretion pathway protein A